MKLFCCSLVLTLMISAAIAAEPIQVFFSSHGGCTEAADPYPGK